MPDRGECGKVVGPGEHHCWWHHVDESQDSVYIICGECWHVYPTAAAFRKEYRRAAGFPSLSEVRLRRDGWHMGLVDLARYTLRWLHPTADNVGFCQLCIHDF